MFSPAHALRFEAPMPPIPMAARFSLLLGASWPPSTRLGTMAADSAARAAVEVNCLRERAAGSPGDAGCPGDGRRHARDDPAPVAGAPPADAAHPVLLRGRTDAA